MYMIIHSSFIHKSQKAGSNQNELQQMNELLTKRQYIHGILPSNKREQIPDIVKNLMDLRGIILSEKKSLSQKVTYCVVLLM